MISGRRARISFRVSNTTAASPLPATQPPTTLRPSSAEQMLRISATRALWPTAANGSAPCQLTTSQPTTSLACTGTVQQGRGVPQGCGQEIRVRDAAPWNPRPESRRRAAPSSRPYESRSTWVPGPAAAASQSHFAVAWVSAFAWMPGVCGATRTPVPRGLRSSSGRSTTSVTRLDVGSGSGLLAREGGHGLLKQPDGGRASTAPPPAGRRRTLISPAVTRQPSAVRSTASGRVPPSRVTPRPPQIGQQRRDQGVHAASRPATAEPAFCRRQVAPAAACAGPRRRRRGNRAAGFRRAVRGPPCPRPAGRDRPSARRRPPAPRAGPGPAGPSAPGPAPTRS